MTKKLLFSAITIAILLCPNLSFSQLNLGILTSFEAYTGAGAVTNSGGTVTGDVGTNLGIISGFDSSYSGNTYNADTVTAQARQDLLRLYIHLNDLPVDFPGTHAPAFGAGEIITPGVYYIGGAGSIGTSLTLDGGGNPNAFFVLRFNGALTVGAAATVTLTGGAQSCNVFYVVDGAISVAANANIKGTLFSKTGAVGLGADVVLEGRMLTMAGAITMGVSSIASPPPCVSAIPISCDAGCSSAPAVDVLGVLSDFSLFTSLGAVANTGISGIIGNIGTHAGAISGYITGVHIGTENLANALTAQAKIDLDNAYIKLMALPNTVTTHAAAFGAVGAGETLTAGVYFINGAGSLGGTITLDGQNNSDAIFVFKFAGAFAIGAQAKILLANGAKRCNVFWLGGAGVTTGAVNIGAAAIVKGNFISHGGACNSGAGVFLGGRQLSTSGAVNTAAGVIYTNPECVISQSLLALVAEYHFDECTVDNGFEDFIGTADANGVGSINSVSTGQINRAVSIGKFDGNTSDSAVDTTVDINSLGNKGTIAFWYQSNADWKGGEIRTLYDASKGDKYFYLVLGDLSYLYMGINDSANNDFGLDTKKLDYAANEWVHIAAIWDLENNIMQLYVNGTKELDETIDSSGALGDLDSLYMGDNRNPDISAHVASPNEKDYSGQSGNGQFDELRIFNYALSQDQITTIYSYDGSERETVVCDTIDHYEISLPASSISCLPTTVSVTACANSSNPCDAIVTAVLGTVSVATTAGTVVTPLVLVDGIGTTTLSYPAAANDATATVSISVVPVAATHESACRSGAGCSTTFNTAGFIFSASSGGVVATLPTQVAGTSSNLYYLRAIKTNTVTQACETALVGTKAVDFAYECNNPTTCSSSNLMDVNGGGSTTIARNNNDSVTSYEPVNMTFDANGNAPFTFYYSDVGQVKLYASKAASDSLLSTLSGSSNPFVVKPGGFVLSDIKQTVAPELENPAAADATGAKFVKAGEAFTAMVTATTSGGATTPNFGRETVPEGVMLTSNLVADLGLTHPGIFAGTFGGFTGGVATGTSFTWDEVGIITLTPSIMDGDYLGVGDVSGTISDNVGRFIPDHFNTTVINNGSFAPFCSGFSYIGQGFGYDVANVPELTIEAKNTHEITTLNYRDNFVKLTSPLSPQVVIAAPITDNTQVGIDGGNPLLNITWAPAERTLTPYNDGTLSLKLGETDVFTYTREHNALVAPFDTDITLEVTEIKDSDGVEASASPAAIFQPLAIEQRYGRLRLGNAHGSELLELPMPLTAEYWNGSAFSLNDVDSCSSFTEANLTLDSAEQVDIVGDNQIKVNGVGKTSATIKNQPLSSGDGELAFSAPVSGGDGWVDVELTVPNYLKFDWNGTGDDNPTARATFGIYKGSESIIYLRETTWR